MNYNFDMHGKWVPTNYFNETVRDYDNKYLGKWIKEEKDMSAKFTFRGVEYDIDVPEGVLITLRTLVTGDRIADGLFTEKEVNFEDAYRFFTKLVLHQLHNEGFRIVGSNDVASTYPLTKTAINTIYGLNGVYGIDYSALSWKCNIPEIKNVIYNMPATIVEWSDGTKTVSKCEDGEIFDREKGLMAAYMQKMESLKGRKLWKTLNKWLPKGLDMDNEPVNENMSTYVQSKLSRDYEKNCKKLDKQIKAKTGKSLKKLIFETEWDKAVDKNVNNVIELAKGDLSEEEAEYIKNDIMATADYIKRLYQTKQEKDFAEVWDSLPKDVKEAAESKIVEAVEQADIDDDRTKEPALEKKDQLNQEFDKLMNPPVDNDTPEWNKWSLRKDRPLNKTTVDRHKYLPVLESHDGFDRYEKSSYLTPSEASKWLRKNDHDIVVAIDEYKGIYYTGEDMSWQLMSRIIETIDTHDIHNVIFNRHKEMLYPTIESWESLNGKPRKIGTPDKLINFEYLCLMVVR